jgi:hypothetical protein
MNYNVNNPRVVSVLERLVRSDRNLEVGSVNTAMAVTVYENVKEFAASETKSCIANELKMKVNGSVFENAPFILSAHDCKDTPKLLKILRVPEGVSALATRQQDLRYEAESVKFKHEAIVPMERNIIDVDLELSTKANCRTGKNEVLVMPWYNSTLNQHPSNCLNWIAVQGRRILDALYYLHSYSDEKSGYVHMDVKAMNVFVDHQGICFLGDFGSCKPIGETITSCSINFCWKDVFGLPAHPVYDYFMLLLMLLIECLEDRRLYTQLFYDPESRFASLSKVLNAAEARINQPPSELGSLLAEVSNKVRSFETLLSP